MALEFGEHDTTMLSHSIGQGNSQTSYVLIHVVESASARLLGRESDDFETVTDKERMQQYVQRMKEKGYAASGHIGFRDRAREIVRIVKETDADMLVIGGHRHSGVKDWIYGETINSVRHELTIPVLVVNF